MAGTGNVYVISASNISDTTTRVSIGFDIAFDWGGWNSYGAPWSITCDGQVQSGTATFNIASGGGNWVWANIAYGVNFDVSRSTSDRAISISATIETKVNPATISASTSYTVPAGVFGSVPGIPTNCKATRNSDSQITITWENHPDATSGLSRTYIEESTNDGAYSSNINTTTSGTQTSFARTGRSANSKYVYRLCAENSKGRSGFGYTNVVYTTPATPQSASAIKTGNNVGLIADVSNIKYPKSYQWQRASNSSFSSGLTTLSGTDSSLSDTTTLATPYYRVRCLGQSGTYSGWRTATLSINPQLYVQIPDGKTIQDVYINKG